MNNKYQHLFSPLTVRGKVYKNRIETAPTYFGFRVFDDNLPEVKENVYRMVEKRAEGGAAAVSIGESPINFDDGVSLFAIPFDYSVYEGRYFDAYKEYAYRIKKAGALAIAEVCHEGLYSMSEGCNPVGPCEMTREDGVHVRGMDEKSMDKIVGEFVQTAIFMKKAGFDIYMLHGGHGFLLQQFLSPYFNKRTDEYGGSDENRARFPLRVLKSVREAIGDDMVLELRMSAEDGIPGGMKLEDTLEFYRMIDGLVDVIHVSNGLKLKGASTRTFTSMFDEHGYNVKFAEQVKNVVSKSKVAVIGGINHPDMAEQIIAENKADLIVLGRQAFADPEFANKANKGRVDEIRKCVRCHQCYPGIVEEPTDPGTRLNQKDIGRCAINPKENFFFYPDELPIPVGSKKVLIIGGGISGMQAALTLAERGHHPIIVERENYLGGTLCFTDADHDKPDLNDFKNSIIRQVEVAGIEVRLNINVDSEYIRQEAPDVAIVAIGGHQFKPQIPGIDKAINAMEAYANPKHVGSRILLVGGGLVGCEVGLCFAGMGHKVTIAEMQDIMAPETTRAYRTTMFEEINARDIELVNGVKCVRMMDDGAVFTNKDGKEILLKADTVIYSLGMRPNQMTIENIEVPIIKIGDCDTIGNVRSCITSGYLAALSIV